MAIGLYGIQILECFEPKKKGLSFGGAGALSGITACESVVEFIEMGLQSFLNGVVEGSELDAHSDSRIAGSNHTAGLDFFFVHPKLDVDLRAQLKRQQALNITAAAANVSGVSIHLRAAAVVETDLDGKEHFVPCETPLVLAGNNFLFLPRGQVLPGTALVGKHLHASFDLPRYPGIDDPDDFEAGFLIAVLNADDVPSLQRMSDARDLRAFAEILPALAF